MPMRLGAHDLGAKTEPKMPTLHLTDIMASLLKTPGAYADVSEPDWVPLNSNRA